MAEVQNPVADPEEAGGAGGDAAVVEGTGGRTLGRQITLLMRKSVLVKKRALKWTLLEIFFPLYPIFFLYLIFTFGADFLPYEKIVTEAVDYQPAEPLLNTSLPGLVFMMSVGGKLGFAPATPADADAARMVQTSVCLITDAMYPMFAGGEACQAAMQGGDPGAMAGACPPAPDDICALYADPATMNANDGWMYMPEGEEPREQRTMQSSTYNTESVNNDEVNQLKPPGMYIGVEVSQKGLNIRHEEMILVGDMSGDPMEGNAVGNGLLAVQALSSFALLSYNVCPGAECVLGLSLPVPDATMCQEDVCGADCQAALAATLAPGADPLEACRTDPANILTINPQCVELMACVATNAPALAMANPQQMYVEKFPVLETIKLVNFRFVQPFFRNDFDCGCCRLEECSVS